MKGVVDETVGEGFQVDLLQLARDKTLEVILKSARRIQAGMTEKEARVLVQSIQLELGGQKSWHPPQIRFGENTVLPFGSLGAGDVVLAEDDIFFFDIGPVFHGHEGDVGRTFLVGQDAEMKRCCADVEAIWHEVRNHWAEENVTGEELYRFAEKRAEARGWKLALEKANGHRIADFPHAAKMRGSIQEFGQVPSSDRWILEIQICHPDRKFGAFFEDLLSRS